MKYIVNSFNKTETFCIFMVSIMKFLAAFSSAKYVFLFLILELFKNKRAQRALARSPEEKVKGHSGAIYRGPLMLSTKYW